MGCIIVWQLTGPGGCQQSHTSCFPVPAHPPHSLPAGPHPDACNLSCQQNETLFDLHVEPCGGACISVWCMDRRPCLTSPLHPLPIPTMVIRLRPNPRSFTVEPRGPSRQKGHTFKPYGTGDLYPSCQQCHEVLPGNGRVSRTRPFTSTTLTSTAPHLHPKVHEGAEAGDSKGTSGADLDPRVPSVLEDGVSSARSGENSHPTAPAHTVPLRLEFSDSSPCFSPSCSI